jgi:hypothetical protein
LHNTLLFPTPTPGEEKLVVETMRVDPDFFTVYDAQPLAGRLFAADRPGVRGQARRRPPRGCALRVE